MPSNVPAPPMLTTPLVYLPDPTEVQQVGPTSGPRAPRRYRPERSKTHVGTDLRHTFASLARRPDGERKSWTFVNWLLRLDSNEQPSG